MGKELGEDLGDDFEEYMESGEEPDGMSPDSDF
jgi:hypothetical protein